MPILPSAKKALRVSERKQIINTRVRSKMRNAMKAFITEPSIENLKTAYSQIDRAVKQNLLHRNTAARRKSLLSRTLKQTEQSK